MSTFKSPSSVESLKKHLRDTGLVTVSGYKKRDLENMRFKVNMYQQEVKKLQKIDLKQRYKKVKFGKKVVNLTPDQNSIVIADKDSHYKIIACAGSGKTTTIICRIKYLIDSGVQPYQIMLTTFNVDAAENMKQKLASVFGFVPNIYVGTIDALAFRFYMAYFKRSDFIGVAEYCSELLKFLHSDSESARKLCEKFKYVFFDEFQDCNDVQYEIVKYFAKRSWVTVIGDDAQNIYQWRGSNMDFILRFEDYLPKRIEVVDDANTTDDVVNTVGTDIVSDDTISAGSADSDAENMESASCKVMTLKDNFRSTPEIVEFANRSIEKNTDQIPKEMIASKKSINRLPRVEVYKNIEDESVSTVMYIRRYILEGKIRPEEIAVLARNNYSIKKLEETLEIHNAKHPTNRIDYVALISDDTRDTKPKMLPNHITLTTIHKSKGLEWDVVLMLSCNDDKFPSETTPIKLQEDRRLFYVGVTRAKRYLTFSFLSNKRITRFIGELDPELYDFDESKKRYFKYDDSRNIKFKSGVTQLIEMLEPSDITNMREFGLLPSIDPVTRKVHAEHSYSSYIDKYYLQADYGIYIDRYISRQLGIMVPESGGLEDSVAHRVLHSLVLQSSDYKLYMKYNFNIQRKIDQAYAEHMAASAHGTKALVERIDRAKDDFEYITQIDPNDAHYLEKLLQRIISEANTVGCDPSQLFVTVAQHIPYEFYDEYYNAYQRYRSKVSGEIVIKDIYRTSLCQNVYDGRRRLLYRDCFDQFNQDPTLYDDINKWCTAYSGQPIKTKAMYNDRDSSICGELDLIVLGDQPRIIDFKCSQTSECKLEWVVQLLMYAALHFQKCGQKINALSVYNPLKGVMVDINIGDWNLHLELLQFMDSIRTQRMQN